ncbi:MAG: AraC family transcriptional regulator [Deltaproteobacteria bacterium]|nr:AraC family transcriptional regulator [Deltaproteobacteria bacterium]
MMKLTTNAQVIQKFLTLTPRFGHAPESLCAEAGLSREGLDDPEARVPVDDLLHLWEVSAKRVNRYDLGLLATELFTLPDYGLLGFVCMNSSTLADAFVAVVRYSKLWTDDPRWHMLANGAMRLEYRTGARYPLGLRCATEAALVELVHGARLLLGERLIPEAVLVRHRAPPDRSPHDAFFGVVVRFGSKTNEVRFERETLNRQVAGSSAPLGEFLRGLANRTLDERAGLIGKVQELIAKDLVRGLPTETSIAKSLGLSTRSLRRRLQESSTSFREVFAQARTQLAQDYLRNSTLPHAEIAFLLGFQELSAFYRAFRHWTGLTPGDFRREHVEPEP